MSTTNNRQTDVQSLCLDNVVAEIQALGLQGIDRAEIAVCVPHYNGNVRRGISVFSARWLYAGGPTTRDDIGYGCAVVFVVQNNGTPEEEVRLNAWEHAVRRRFMHTPAKPVDFNGATACRWSVEPLEYQFPRDVRNAEEFTHRALLVRYWVREPRDIGK